jgi:hypothetical protein
VAGGGYCGAMFGRRRKDEEDPFAALKDGGTYQSAPMTVPPIGDTTTAAPVASQPPAPPAPPAPTKTWVPPSGPRPQRGGSGLGTQIGVRLAVAGVFALVAVGIPLIAAHHASHSGVFSVPSFNLNPGSTPSTPSPSRTQINYLSSAGVSAGLAHIGQIAPGARVSQLRLDHHSLSVTAIPRHGGSKLIYFGPNGTFVTSAPSTGQAPVAMSQVRPAALHRLLAGMRTRFHTPASRIDYIVLSSPQGSSPSWVIFTTAPSHPGYLATLSGAGLHRIA